MDGTEALESAPALVTLVLFGLGMMRIQAKQREREDEIREEAKVKVAEVEAKSAEGERVMRLQVMQECHEIKARAIDQLAENAKVMGRMEALLEQKERTG